MLRPKQERDLGSIGRPGVREIESCKCELASESILLLQWLA